MEFQQIAGDWYKCWKSGTILIHIWKSKVICTLAFGTPCLLYADISHPLVPFDPQSFFCPSELSPLHIYFQMNRHKATWAPHRTIVLTALFTTARGTDSLLVTNLWNTSEILQPAFILLAIFHTNHGAGAGLLGRKKEPGRSKTLRTASCSIPQGTKGLVLPSQNHFCIPGDEQEPHLLTEISLPSPVQSSHCRARLHTW